MPDKSDTVRLDKWLWAVRLYKTRSLATEAVKSGRVKVAGESVKPSFEVKSGLVITIQKGVVKYQFLVTGILQKRVSAPIAREFCKDITPDEEKMKLTHIEFMPSAFREKGSGRPTKKERRELDEWMEN
jgi:ribosome-associated heat shock protein Hsp15